MSSLSFKLGEKDLGAFGMGLSLYSPWAALHKRIPSEEEDEENIRTVMVAIESGVRLLDSATYYGNDSHGLKLLSKIVNRVGREKVLISIKFGVSDISCVLDRNP